MEPARVMSGNPYPEKTRNHRPLIVDLDGTLLKTDIFWESILILFKQNPLIVFFLPTWLLKGRAFLKKEVSRRVSLDVSILPYNNKLFSYLLSQRAKGRRLYLATGADENPAKEVADYLKIFESVFASDGITNLTGRHKKERLIETFGEKGFDYAGNSAQDIPVWSTARRAILVNPSQRLRTKAGRVTDVVHVFEDRKQISLNYLKALRVHHWFKNLILFAPLVAAHRAYEPILLKQACIGFLSFCFLASSVYILNDLLDLAADRHHPHKRSRAFAAGQVPIPIGLCLIPVLLGLSFLMGILLPATFLGIIIVYYVITLTYSLFLKQVVILDLIILAGLFATRLLAGSATVDIWPSSWLMVFSIFIFLSLAMVKRYKELIIMHALGGETAKARNYEVSDREIIKPMGIASGYVSVLVLALYIASDTAQNLYARSQAIWFLCPLLLYWISYIWLTAHRMKMNDDPVVFAMKDRTSLIILILMAATVLIAL
jgi:4-hydroxybenzoate polyprenyltransferase/phosphoserine phosphatase